MPGHRGPAAAGQQLEPAVEAGRDLLRGHGAQPGRGQLDGQRHAVERTADPRHSGRVGLGETEPREDGAGPLDQQAHRGVSVDTGRRPGWPGGKRAGPFRNIGRYGGVRWQRQRAYGPPRFPRDVQRLAAGGQDADLRAGGEDAVGQRRRGLDQVLAVVQDQQRSLCGQRGQHPAERVRLLVRRRGLTGRQPRGQRLAGVEQRLLAQAEHAQDGGDEVGRVGDGGQLDQPHPVGHRGRLGAGGLDGQPGLARPAGAGEGDQAVRGQKFGDLGEFGVAPDEAGELGAQVAAAGAGRGRGAGFGRGIGLRGLGLRGLGLRGLGLRGLGLRGLGGRVVGAQDGQVQGGQLGRWLYSQLVDEPLLGLLVDLQGVAAAPAGVQRAHQPGGQRLAHRMRHHQALELGDEGGGDAGAQVGVDAVLGGKQPELIQAGDDGPAEIAVGHVHQGRAAPQRERLAQGRGGGSRVVAQLYSAAGGELFEPDDVGRAGIEFQLVAGGPGFDDRVRQRAAQPGNQGLQRVRRARRRLVGPQPVNQLAGRDQLAGAQRQHDQQRAQPGSADVERGPRVVIGADLKRPEHGDLHSSIVPDPARSPAWLVRGGGHARRCVYE
jgi:hypothetical protein